MVSALGFGALASGLWAIMVLCCEHFLGGSLGFERFEFDFRAARIRNG